jgi:hypothetical protein
MDRRRLVVAALAVTSLALAVAGVVVWREMSPSIAALAARCSSRRELGCGFAFPPPYRLHPLRAELLWAAAAVTGLLAVGQTLGPSCRRDGVVRASG